MWAWGFQGVDFQAVLHLICRIQETNFITEHPTDKA